MNIERKCPSEKPLNLLIYHKVCFRIGRGELEMELEAELRYFSEEKEALLASRVIGLPILFCRKSMRIPRKLTY